MIFSHRGMSGTHALNDEGNNHGIGAHAFSVVGFNTVTDTVVFGIVAQGFYEVVWPVSADAAIKVQLL